MGISVVTGGAGFIASNLVDALLAEGEGVRILDNFSTGREENLAHLSGNPKAEIVYGDVTDPKIVGEVLSGADIVYHQAAMGSVTRSVDNPELTTESNVLGSLYVLDAARKLKIRRVVLAGSSSVYGDSPELPKKEDQPLTPISPYAASKAAMEHYAAAFAHCYPLETVTLRYFNVYGPRQDPKSLYAAVVPAFVSALLEKKSGEIYGDGEQSRDFTFVGDVCRANLLAARAPAKKVNGRAFNIAGGIRISVRRLYEEIARLAGASEVKPSFFAARAGDVRHTQADISRAAEALGWRPEVELADGLRRTLEWFKAHG